MQFIKKNYEKVLLGVVLLGLVAVAMFMLLLVAGEKQAQEERRMKIINRPVRPLAPVDVSYAEGLVNRASTMAFVNFSDNTNRLFNPLRWQRAADGRVIKNPVGTDLERLNITKITPLYLTISLDRVTVSDSGARYQIGIEQQAAARVRGKRSLFMSVGDKREYGERDEPIIVREAQGPTNNPTQLVLELGEEKIGISETNPYRRIEGYSADMRYPPENGVWTGRRVGDRIRVAGEDYRISAISEDEVVLSAISNQKKWTIKYNGAR